MNKIGKNKGITLVALVVTIIILLILAGITISQLTGSGLFTKAQQAATETTKQMATEEMNLKITNMQIEKYAEKQRMPTLQEFADGLCEDNEIQYVELQSKKLGSLSKIEVGNASSIFTKLKEYPYEFEINSSLQLASIDGVQVATENNNNNNSTGIKAFVLGSIASYSTSSNQYAAFGYSSDPEYFLCEGSLEKNYLIVNALKDMHIKIVLQEAGRGEEAKRTIAINNTIVDTVSMSLRTNHKYEADVSAGDVIKITSVRSSSVRGTAIGIFCIE